jgi:hypothetical protein
MTRDYFDQLGGKGRAVLGSVGALILLLAIAVAVSSMRLALKRGGTAAAGSQPAHAALTADPGPQFGEVTSLDDLVFGWLAHLGIDPAEPCTDSEFVRRAYLDVIGVLPTAPEVRRFLGSADPDKRRKLIDELLVRDEFADYWAMKWGDILRIKAEFPINLWPNAAQAYHQWVRASLAANKPCDVFVRELLTASGSNFRVGPVNFYRAMQDRSPDGIAATVALTFMGTRVEHWTAEQRAGLAVFFSQVGYKPSREWKEEIVFWDPLGAGTTATNHAAGEPTAPASADGTVWGTLPDGRRVLLSGDRDPREVFADWLVSATNRWFARNLANRAWAWLLGRGIVHEPDDFRPANPPANPQLLAHLEKEFIASRYDLRQLFRLILNSRTYQLAARPQSTHPLAGAHFASYPVRRVEAEVLIDAINGITGTSELYTSPIPEPFTYIPQGTPAVALADGSITSPFLALFGRSARATGLEGERINNVLPAQMLQLLNSSHIQQKLQQGSRLRALIDSKRPARDIIDELYLTVLSRYPTAEEAKRAQSYAAPSAAGKSARASSAGTSRSREDWVDIAWALINSDEFLFRH